MVEILFYLYRFANGTAIPNASINVKGRKHAIKSTKFGDYFRLLLAGNYEITAVADGKSITQSVRVIYYLCFGFEIPENV